MRSGEMVKHTPPVDTAGFELHVPSRSVTLLASVRSPCAKTDDDMARADRARRSIGNISREVECMGRRKG